MGPGKGGLGNGGPRPIPGCSKQTVNRLLDVSSFEEDGSCERPSVPELTFALLPCTAQKQL